MNRVAFLLGALAFCHSVGAADWGDVYLSVDGYRFYFDVTITDLPTSDTQSTFNIYSEGGPILPQSFEQFLVRTNNSSGAITDGPRVQTVGAPAMDRWQDGDVAHFSHTEISPGTWQFVGSIVNGAQGFQPGDRPYVSVNYPGGTHGLIGTPIEAAAKGALHISKTSTTRFVSRAGQVVPYTYRVENVSPIFLHDVSLDDDNVDEPPVCAFSGSNDELWPEGQPGSTVSCTAWHTVTQDEIDVGGTVDNTATASSDETEPVMASHSIPVAMFADSFESPPNIITVLDD